MKQVCAATKKSVTSELIHEAGSQNHGFLTEVKHLGECVTSHLLHEAGMFRYETNCHY